MGRSGYAVEALAALIVLIYANSLYGPFMFDDQNNIVDNVHIHITSLSPGEVVGAGPRHSQARTVARSRLTGDPDFPADLDFRFLVYLWSCLRAGLEAHHEKRWDKKNIAYVRRASGPGSAGDGEPQTSGTERSNEREICIRVSQGWS